MNPYEPPRAPPAPDSLDFDEVMRRDLRVIAQSQQIVLVCIAANIALFVALMVFRDTVLWPFLRFLAIGVTGFQLWGVWRLSSKLYGGGIAVFATLGMFIPCFSLVVLLMLSQAATKRLRDSGVQVGLFGARLSDLPK